MNPPSPFKTVAPLHRWLARKLAAKKDLSQRAVAAAIQRDTSQVNRWFNGKEPIPYAMFMATVVVIDPRLEQTAASLWTAHQLATFMLDDAHRFLPDADEATARRVASDLVDRAEVSALDGMGDDADPEGYGAMHLYLNNGRTLLRLASDCLSKRERFIAPANVESHLRFPFNLMGGDLLGREPQTRAERQFLRATLVPDMRRTARSKDGSREAAYCRQHAQHMLSRYGGTQDEAFVRELIGRASDPYTRRTAHYSEIINVADPAAAEPFVHELNLDSALSRVTLEFDFVHYGDRVLHRPDSRGVPRGTIRNCLRRARQRNAPGQVCLVKLCHILLEVGVDAFQPPVIRARIEALLTQLYEIASEHRTRAERQFLQIFSAHGAFQASRERQLELFGGRSLTRAPAHR